MFSDHREGPELTPSSFIKEANTIKLWLRILYAIIEWFTKKRDKKLEEQVRLKEAGINGEMWIVREKKLVFVN